ncbi:hypothetical protein [Achromobacter insolitus]|jgi:hypothetical protein|uniref:Uncharacterized protein n=1 Tax=Achromobacter insolitus TaxID=217204 RepID=A0A6S7F8F3_9BURK|nr:hypothetical protein [Achromobacter insolitus]CAB3937262.1 hypothetical protein LMG6000_05289 [Achromobacter insolitus]CAB3945794.1 hypothetical protein LMG5997_05723 [Achromobacter insolitus]
MSAIPEPDERLSQTEVEAVLQSMSPADWRRAEAIATVCCGGLTGWTPDDLLQEALCRLLSETRVWRPGLHPLVVLKTVMRSIGSNARKHNDASPIDQNVVVEPVGVDQGEKVAAVHGEVTVTPEDELSGKQQMATLYAALGGDEDLELLAMTWADGLRGADARDALGWDERKYDAARNRFLRRLKALDPDLRPT